MKFKSDFVKIIHYLEIQSSISKNDSQIYFPFKLYSWNFVTSWREQDALHILLDSYINHFKKSLRFYSYNRYPLINSYILPCHIYETVMNWVSTTYDQMYPLIIPYRSRQNVNHIGGIYERIMSIAIGELDDLIPMELDIEFVDHDHVYKQNCNNDIAFIDKTICDKDSTNIEELWKHGRNA